jgi:hypothetical protein
MENPEVADLIKELDALFESIKDMPMWRHMQLFNSIEPKPEKYRLLDLSTEAIREGDEMLFTYAPKGREIKLWAPLTSEHVTLLKDELKGPLHHVRRAVTT